MKARQKHSPDTTDQKDAFIALLQGQLNACATEMQGLRSQVVDLELSLIQKDQEITIHGQTINATRRQLVQYQQIITEQNTLITKQAATLEENKKDIFLIGLLKHELRQLKKMIHGRSSEKYYGKTDDNAQPEAANMQLMLNLQAETVAVCRITDARKVAGHTRYTKEIQEKTPHPGRHDFPPGLEQEVTIKDVADKPEGAVCIGMRIQKQLACTPSRFYLKVTRFPIYMVPAREEGSFKQLVAPLAPHPIPKCKADISVLVMMVIDKYLYHLPVYRQQQRFKQYGIELKYNTLVGWLNRIADVLEPLYQLLLRELLISQYIQMDETRFRVLDNEKKKGKKSHIGWLWLCANPVQKIVAFTYKQGRGNKDVFPLLKDFTGYLQTDGYGAYHRYGRKPGVTHLQCMVHCRRYFVEARENDPKRADTAIEQFFGPLYAIEQQCRDQALSYDEVTERRMQHAAPILNALFQWLQCELPLTILRSPIHKAITYTLARRKELMVYTTDGMLDIDNYPNILIMRSNQIILRFRMLFSD